MYLARSDVLCHLGPSVLMLSALSAAAIAGLFGSPHCVGMCGPFALACGGRASHTAAWHGGKLTTYGLLGAVAGAFGSVLPGPTWVGTVVSAGVVVWFSAALAGLAPEPTLRVPGLQAVATRAARKDDLASRYVFGLANGLLPCGLVYAALGLAVATGSAAVGALTMTVFGLGTVPALAAFGLGARRLTSERPWARKVLAGAVLVSGLWVVVQRAGMDVAGM